MPDYTNADRLIDFYITLGAIAFLAAAWFTYTIAEIRRHRFPRRG